MAGCSVACSSPAAVALATASSPALVQTLVTNRILFFGLLIAELALVYVVSAKVDTLSPTTSAGLFLLYSALNGITLSLILLVYTGGSIVTAFLTTAGMFGGLALYGTVTKRSMDGIGSFAMMGLFGVIIAMLVNFFLKSPALSFVMSVACVIVFTGLTAYDAQRLKRMALAVDGPQAGSYAVSGALSLYLNFINLFLSLLRLFGNRR
jgi:FtsH-binding integral membrane protein